MAIRKIVALLCQMLDEPREHIRQAHWKPEWCDDRPQETASRLNLESAERARPVFNLTGTVLHTNLGARYPGRKPRWLVVARGVRAPVTLEYDLDDAGRGHRDRALAVCCAALPARKMPVSSITTRRRCC